MLDCTQHLSCSARPADRGRLVSLLNDLAPGGGLALVVVSARIVATMVGLA